MHYKRTQIGWLMILVLGVVTLIVVASGASLAVAAILAACLVLFPTLTVEGTERGLDVRFGPGLVRRRISWADIRAARPVRNTWLAGWGIRWIGSGWMYNVSGLDAVELSLASGRTFRIGTDDPRGLHAFIAAHLREVSAE
jgi:hypothetical protein